VTRPAFPRVGIVAKSRLHEAGTLLAEIAAWLETRGVTPIFETATAQLAGREGDRGARERDDLPPQVDLMLVLGGDGTLLGMADRIAHAGVDVPILGVNFGSLGFLTEVTLDELYPTLDAALAGQALFDERLMLFARSSRGGQVFSERCALNDVVITKGAMSRIIDLSVWVGGQFVTRFKADGLIVATPTGSTAYNLAAGGPIVHPHVDALLLTPIAPHTLTNRPIVIPASADVRIQPLVDGGQNEIFATFDGQFGFPLRADDEVNIRRAARPLRLLRSSGRTYFELLRQKLKWGER
jgi:NAD+ kinase